MHKDCQSNEPFFEAAISPSSDDECVVYRRAEPNREIEFPILRHIFATHVKIMYLFQTTGGKKLTPTTTNERFFYTISNFGKKRIVMVKRRNSCYISLSLSPNNMLCQEDIQIFRVLWDYYIYCNRGP